MRQCDVLELWRFRVEVGALARTDQHRDVLLAIDRVGDRRRIDAGADIVAPEFLQCLGIVGRERSVDVLLLHSTKR